MLQAWTMSLEYGATQVIVLVALVLVALGFVAVFAVVALAGTFDLEFGRVRKAG